MAEKVAVIARIYPLNEKGERVPVNAIFKHGIPAYELEPIVPRPLSKEQAEADFNALYPPEDQK
jgi:hypothetical protein